MFTQYKSELHYKNNSSNVEKIFLSAAKKHLELKERYHPLSLELEQKTASYYQMLSVLTKLEMDFAYQEQSNIDVLIKHLSSIRKSDGNDSMPLKEKIHQLKSVMAKKEHLFKSRD